jgi:chromosome segregation protein
MHGFKSFPRKTEIPLTPEINVIIGLNGSGKSNITDALCFVLGRLSIKSLRAAKARNLIFMGTKSVPPSNRASVEIVFDNSDKVFSLDKKEISIKRIVKKNGQSIYEINDERRTRQEVLTLLSQAGIDPNGFNIILQGEIQNFVRMHNEERRKIIEEVSGISVYESRKEKSLKELEKTDNRLSEINTILKERTNYLNNLERERKQALRYKQLERDIKNYQASIINFDLQKNKKILFEIVSEIEKKKKEILKIKKEGEEIQSKIKNFEEKIEFINSDIQKATGVEQEKLNGEITNLRAELAGITVNIENYEKKLIQLEKQRNELNENISRGKELINDFQNKEPGNKKVESQKEVGKRKEELEELERKIKQYYMWKSDLKTTKEKLDEKKYSLQSYVDESDFLFEQIKSLSKQIYDKNTSEIKIKQLENSLEEKKRIIKELSNKEIELEKISYNNENEIEKQNKLSERISSMDTCPLCKNKITKEHASQIKLEASQKVDELKKQISDSDKELSKIYEKRSIIEQNIEQLTEEINKRKLDLVNLSNITEKENQIKLLEERKKKINDEIKNLNAKEKFLSKKLEEGSNMEEKYETLKIEFQEISLRSDKNLDSEISFKKREISRLEISLNQIDREKEEIKEELKILREKIDKKQKLLEIKKKKEEELTNKFKKSISEREDLQKRIRSNEYQYSLKQNEIHNVEQKINDLKIEKARIDASVENLDLEFSEFKEIKIIKSNRENLIERLNNAQNIIDKIGSVNLRSLEVYDSVKKQYDEISEKVNKIKEEKESIIGIISEIDLKKKRVFLKTLKGLNDIFSSNFEKLSSKGKVFLDLEDKNDPFAAGVNIVVKTGHGKYFDVTSLSGGEQTMVALSLIFAIQELNPYAFYVLDEIDAALDKRNSERLASLLRRYMERGQYIVITHNDELISNASNIYGVSMNEGVSKILSIKV